MGVAKCSKKEYNEKDKLSGKEARPWTENRIEVRFLRNHMIAGRVLAFCFKETAAVSFWGKDAENAADSY